MSCLLEHLFAHLALPLRPALTPYLTEFLDEMENIGLTSDHAGNLINEIVETWLQSKYLVQTEGSF